MKTEEKQDLRSEQKHKRVVPKLRYNFKVHES